MKKNSIEKYICQQLKLEKVSIGKNNYYLTIDTVGKLKPTIECFLRDEIRFIKRSIKILKSYKEYYCENNLQITINSMNKKLKEYNTMLRQLIKK